MMGQTSHTDADQSACPRNLYIAHSPRTTNRRAFHMSASYTIADDVVGSMETRQLSLVEKVFVQLPHVDL